MRKGWAGTFSGCALAGKYWSYYKLATNRNLWMRGRCFTVIRGRQRGNYVKRKQNIRCLLITENKQANKQVLKITKLDSRDNLTL